MQRLKIGFCFLATIFMLGGCATTGGNTPETKRQAILDMRDQVLAELYKEYPQARTEIASAPGYAVFCNINVYLIYFGLGGGYGVVTDNKTGRNTFMKMGKAGLGLGFGATDFRAVFIFNQRSVMQQFINSGWEFGGQADAAFKPEHGGGAVGGEAVVSDITIYKLNENGLALQVTVQGTKYWKDDELN